MSAVPKRAASSKTLNVFDLIGSADSLIFQLAGKGGDWKVSGVPQLFAILLIQAETLAKSRKPGTPPPLYSRPISLSEFARRCGCSKEYAWRMLTDARKRGLIVWLSPKEAKDLGLPPERGHCQALRFQLTPEKWASAPPYVAPEDADEQQTDDEGEQEEQEQPEPRKQAAVAEPVTLTAGEKTQPAPIPETVKRFAFECAGDSPVVVEARHAKDVITFIARAENKEVTAGTVNLQVHSGKSGNKAPAAAAEAPKSTGLFQSAQGWKELDDAMLSIATAKGPHPFYLGEKLASSMVRKLKCPIAFFVERVTECAERAQAAGKSLTTGHLAHILDEANDKWKTGATRWMEGRRTPAAGPATKSTDDAAAQVRQTLLKNARARRA